MTSAETWETRLTQGNFIGGEVISKLKGLGMLRGPVKSIKVSKGEVTITTEWTALRLHVDHYWRWPDHLKNTDVFTFDLGKSTLKQLPDGSVLVDNSLQLRPKGSIMLKRSDVLTTAE
jgi:hypothetical protein